jgi:integrase/recombinase XerC
MKSQSRAGRRDKILFQLIYAGGLRVSEAVGLKAADIDFTQGTLMVVGKGDKERRIYLKPFVLKQLQQYSTENGLDGYLFPGRGHGHITARNAQMRFKEYVRKAGLPEHVSPHTLRHSIAVHYLIGGAPITFVQSLLGHESLATTGIYTQLADEMTKEIALNTETALDKLEEGKLKEAAIRYEPDFEKWDAFLSQVLEWL